MNWLESKLNDYNVTRYRLSKETGVSERYLKKIIDNDIPLANLKYWQALAISEFFDKMKDGAIVNDNMILNDLNQSKNNIKKQLDDLDSLITSAIIVGDTDRLLHLNDELEKILGYYRQVEEEILKMKEYFGVK